MRISDWSSDVCSSDLAGTEIHVAPAHLLEHAIALIARGIPVLANPVTPDQVLERIGGAPLYANAERAVARNGMRKVVFVGDGDRYGVVWGKSVSVRVGHGGRRNHKKKKKGTSN